MLLTDAQMQEIRQIIADHHQAFVINHVDPSVVAPEIVEALAAKGLVNVQVQSIDDAYLYGQVLAAVQDPRVANMDLAAFKSYLRSNPVPLTPLERQAVTMAKQQAAQYVRGLGNRIDTQTGQMLIEEDHSLRRRMRDTIRTKTAQNIETRQSVKKLKSDLGWATKDWTRDLDRIAITEKQSAMEQGKADLYAKRFGSDVRVAKQAMPDCCPKCAELYNGPDGAPRIFKLADLEANGTNVGRKVGAWRPTVGPTHPHCVCQMIRVPAGWGFDDSGDLVEGGARGESYDPSSLEASLPAERTLRKSLERKGAIADFQNIPIYIETPVGGTRQWTDPSGRSGATTMLYAYGYIKNTHGADNDAIDVYIGNNPLARRAYIIHQTDAVGVYDEDKVMLGFSSEQDACRAFAAHRDDGALRIGGVQSMSMQAFKRWLHAHRHATPGAADVRVAHRPAFVMKAQAQIQDLGATHGVVDRNVRSAGYCGANMLFNPPVRRPYNADWAGKLPERQMLNLKAKMSYGGAAMLRDKDDYAPARQNAPVRDVRAYNQLGRDPKDEQDDIVARRERLAAKVRQRAAWMHTADPVGVTAPKPKLVLRLPGGAGPLSKAKPMRSPVTAAQVRAARQNA